MTKRIVAIVGRPNVGKSAIFNRLAGKRIAIVHAESGVTRDRLMREVTWDEEVFELIDTGGVCNVDGERASDKIDTGIRQQVDAALDDAEVAILVVDTMAGTVPMDEEVAGILRDSGMKVVVAANKCDLPARDGDASEFDKLGLPVFPVSAMHDRGFEPLMEKVLEMLPDEENPTVGDPLKVAVAGRPNVGKSSYINRLLRNNRVIVSDVPGTTRDSIDIPFTVGSGEQARHYLLIDTAGIRRVGKIDSSVERFSRFRAEDTIRNVDVVVLVLDASKGPTAQDKKIAAIIQEHRKGCVVLVNKWDLQEETQTQYGPQVAKAMPFMDYCPIVFVSTKTGYNIRRSVDAIDHVASQVRTELPTGVLNRTLHDAYERVNPPAVKGNRLKIYYATQVGVSPIRIRLFVNNPKLIRDAYRAYLIRILREKFGLEGAPIVLTLSARKRGRK
ncbi:ribosome biogenesis GTPase Der [bacterium E08(2017)]|nr:ribosome biogenesis GTPase Der [bacterium E08(2017)]